MNELSKKLLKNLVILLVDSKFSEIVARGENGRLSEDDIKIALMDYPGEISLPPDTAYDSAYVYDVHDADIKTRQIEFDLWYDGKASDLTLSADIRKNVKGEFVISIDDIHVL